MTSVLYIDVIGGLSGDMLLAALLDAGAPIDEVGAAANRALTKPIKLRTKDVFRGGLRASSVIQSPIASSTDGRTIAAVLRIVDEANLPVVTRRRATSILQKLGKAEARAHGVDVDQVMLHQLGEDDTIVDVVGIAAAIAALGIDEIFVSSLPLAVGGSVPTHGGRVPLPAPATLELLKGFDIRGEGQGELVTPTAAAVLAALAKPSLIIPSMNLQAVGYGAGARNPTDRPNLVRVLLGTRATIPSGAAISLKLLEANVDDLSPELISDAVDALRLAGALDVWTTAVHMKKGRTGIVITALCAPDLEGPLTRLFFETTSTFGVRASEVARTELDRKTVSMPWGTTTVDVKIGILGGHVVSAKLEHDHVVAVARRSEKAVRAVYDELGGALEALRRRLEENGLEDISTAHKAIHGMPGERD